MIPKQYPADIEPKPVLVYSTERLCSTAGLPPIVVQKIGGSTFSANFTDDHLPAGYSTFLAGEPYGNVITVTNQMPNGVGHLTVGSGAIPPRLRPDIKVGPSPSLVFQGGTDQGNVWGLDITPGIHTLPFPVNPKNCTVIAVLRPTSSAYRNQSSSPGLGNGGTILSLDAGVPFAVPGSTIAGSSTITGVSPLAGIEVGMRVDGPPFITGGGNVLQIIPTGPDVANIVLFGTAANLTLTGSLIFFSKPIMRLYQAGDASPDSFAIGDAAPFGGEKLLQPTEFSGVEIAPVVVAWSSNATNMTTDVAGYKAWMNEIVRSSPAVTARDQNAICGFVGRMGASQHGGFSQCGDFWLGALMVWNVALTQMQRAIVADALYQRFQIPERRSIRSSKTVVIMGDSITADYTTFANYGWSKRLADKFPSGVRFLNYATPGSQVTTAPTTPAYGPTDGLFGIAVARHMAYSKAGKNVLVVLAGGNDMVDQAPWQYTIDIATNEVSVFTDTATSASTAAGSKVLTFGAGALHRWLSVGALVSNATAPASIPPGTTVTAITSTTVTLSANVAVPGVGAADVIRFKFHNMQPNMRLQFTSLPLMGDPPIPTTTGISVGVVYYVKTVTAVDKYTISATPGGAVIDVGGTFPSEQGLLQYTKTATGIFGTPTTGGLQKIVADANAAGASRVYLLTVLKRTGSVYDFIREDLNALIMGGGAGGYTPINCDSDPTLANNDTPPNTAGPAYPDGTHLNELGSDALANFFYPTLNAYLSS